MLLLTAVAPTSAQTNTDGATPPGLAPGSAAGSYGLGGFESVNLFSGDLSFSLPLRAAGGRGVGYTMTLPVEQNWRVELLAMTPPNSEPWHTPLKD